MHIAFLWHDKQRTHTSTLHVDSDGSVHPEVNDWTDFHCKWQNCKLTDFVGWLVKSTCLLAGCVFHVFCMVSAVAVSACMMLCVSVCLSVCLLCDVILSPPYLSCSSVSCCLFIGMWFDAAYSLTDCTCVWQTVYLLKHLIFVVKQ